MSTLDQLGQGLVYVTSLKDGTVTVIDPQSLTVLSRIEVGRQPHDIAFVLDQQDQLRAYVTLFQEHKVAVIDLQPGSASRFTKNWRDQMKNLALSLALICGLSLTNACDQTALPPNAELAGASCYNFGVNLSSDTIEYAPLAQCGCLSSELNEQGQRSLSQVPQEQCQTNNDFELVGYLGSPTLDKVAIMHLGNGPRAI